MNSNKIIEINSVKYITIKKIMDALFGNIDLVKKKINNTDEFYIIKTCRKIYYKKAIITGQNENPKKELEILLKLKKYDNIIGYNNIVHIVDYDINNVGIRMLSKYMNKGDLYEIIKNKKFDKFEIKTIFSQIVDGIYFIHKNFYAHRDLSLENILLHEENNKIIVKICDFGQAIYIYDYYYYKYVPGKDYIIAPEIYVSPIYDLLKADIWAIGCIFYVLLTNTFAWDNTLPKNVFFVLFNNVGLKKYLKIYKHYKNISNMEFDCLQKMLTIYNKKRPTISELKNHEYFKN